MQKAVLLTTFALTMIIPLQYAVLVGVGLSLILHVVRQSNQVTIKRWRLSPDGDLIETDPPAHLPANDVVALQGSPTWSPPKTSTPAMSGWAPPSSAPTARTL